MNSVFVTWAIKLIKEEKSYVKQCLKRKGMGMWRFLVAITGIKVSSTKDSLTKEYSEQF